MLLSCGLVAAVLALMLIVAGFPASMCVPSSAVITFTSIVVLAQEKSGLRERSMADLRPFDAHEFVNALYEADGAPNE